LDEIWVGKPIRQHVKEFGAVFGTLFFIIGASKLYHGAALEWCGLWFALGIVMPALGYLAPAALRPLWKGWMKLAHYLSIVMTFVVLSLAWCVCFLPMSLIVRICGVKVIDQSYGNVETYWEKRDPKYDDFKRLEQQY
jgi:hypothetical protein